MHSIKNLIDRSINVAALLVILCASAVYAADDQTSSPPGNQEYLLQSGDEILISVLPRTEYDTSGVIAPDGKLYLKNIGSIRAAGYSLDKVREQVALVLGRTLRAPRISVTLSKLSQPPTGNRVTVVGAVVKPGPLNMEPGLRLRKALELAGGPILEADLRRIVLRHSDLSQRTLDLATSKSVASTDANVLLTAGDSIDVPLLPQVHVTVSGAVNRPGGIDELIPPGAEIRVSRALALAGGTQVGADLGKVTLTHADLTSEILDLSRSDAATEARNNPVLRDGDALTINMRFQPGTVTVTGAVVNPGDYDLKPGASLQDLITAAGKLTLVADWEHLRLQRADGSSLAVNLLALQQEGGRIPVAPGDELHVPILSSVVVLIGTLPNPGPRALKPGQTIRDFFTQGAPETMAALDGSKTDLGAVQLIRRGEETHRINLKAIMQRRGKQNLVLRNGDVLFLPAREESRKSSPLDYLRALPFLAAFL